MSQPASTPDAPRFRYNHTLAGEIETRWQERWDLAGAFRQANPGEPGFDPASPKFYCLDMFPYPSGAGLHVGHPEGYTATDIVSRYKRMRGFSVLHPMGWDAFGLPAEQYAIQTGIHPAITTRNAIDNFRRQLKRFGFSYDWSREFGTIDEEYYRWTQWIFLRLYGSWFDPAAGRARPIADLEAALREGKVGVDTFGEIVAHPTTPNVIAGEAVGVRRWHELSEEERRGVIDSRRLAYLDEMVVNWCPKLGTVLANDEVIDGRSERGGHPVVRKPLRQWVFRITAYAERLLRQLDGLDWPASTKAMQAEWIGRSEGAEIEFELEGFDELIVFTTRPDTLFGATYMVVAPEHELVEAVLAAGGPHAAGLRAYVDAARRRSDVDRQESKDKTGVFTGVHAINPATGKRIPVWTADYVLTGYGTGAIMAVPAHDERDLEFARKFDLPIVEVVRPATPVKAGTCFSGEGVAINSANAEVSIDAMATPAAKGLIIEWLERSGRGRRRVNYKLRDWVFSRQRYWGEPFPIVYDREGRAYPIMESKLPVKLPELADYAPVECDEPQPLLAKAGAWMNTTAGEAGVDPRVLAPSTPVRRETNTMPGSAGSSWYAVRYCDARNGSRFVGKEAEGYWMGGAHPGVDLYVGGSEHAVGHLLYSRFWQNVLFDLGEVSTPEPFRKLFHQGLITSFAYQTAGKHLVPVDEVDEVSEGKFVRRGTGETVTQIVAKMSKSLKNVVNPDDVIAEFGADTFRLYEMYMGPLEASKPWNPRDITGLHRFLQRLWRVAVNEETGVVKAAAGADPALEKQLHRVIAKVGADIERLSLNTAIAAMIEFVNAAVAADRGAGSLTADQIARLALVLSPFAPHVAEELWSRLGRQGFAMHQAWPGVDAGMLVDDTVEVPVQVAGKVRSRIQVPAGADVKTHEAAAMADARVQEFIAGKPVKKVIVVPGKMVNVVV